MKKIDLKLHQQAFLKELEHKGKSFNTVKNYRTDLNIFLGFLALKGRSTIISGISAEELKEFNHYLHEKYNSPNSIRRRVQALRIFWDYLIENGLYDKNPIKNLIVEPKVVDLPRPAPYHLIKKVYMDLRQEESKKKSLEELLSLRNLILIHLIYGAGLKVSDLDGLKQKHISEYKGTFRVTIFSKNKEPQSIPLPESFGPDFKEYQTALEKQKDQDQIDFSDLLFNANPYKILSGRLSPRGIEIIFKEISKEYKKEITAKSLRQSCIFNWLIKGQPEARIKEWMGVQPQYSLSPFKKLLTEKREDYLFQDIGETC